MFKARIGKYYEVDKKVSSLSYLMSPDVKERLVVKLNEDVMIDIDNRELYPIVKRDERGYLESDIELNKDYVISYEPVKDINLETYLKGANAKIQAILNERHNKELNKNETEHTKKLVK